MGPPAPEAPDVPELVADEVAALRGDDLEAAALVLSTDRSGLDDLETLKVLKQNSESLAAELDEALSKSWILSGELREAHRHLEALPAPKSRSEAMFLRARLEAVERREGRGAQEGEILSARLFAAQERRRFLGRRLDFVEAELVRKRNEDAEAQRRREEAEKAEAAARKASQQTEEDLKRLEERRQRALDDGGAAVDIDKMFDEIKGLVQERLYIVQRQSDLVAAEGGLKGQRELFNTYRNTTDAAVKAIRDSQAERNQAEQSRANAYTLFLEMEQRQEIFRQRIGRLEEMVDQQSALLRKARGELPGVYSEFELAQADVPPDGLRGEVAKAKLELSKTHLEVHQRYLQLLEVKLRWITGQRNLVLDERDHARQIQEELISLLSIERRRSLYEWNAQNIEHAGVEIDDFVDGVRIEARRTAADLDELPSRALSIEGVLWCLKMLLVLVALILAFRFLRKNHKPIVKGLKERAHESGLMALRPGLMTKLLEVFDAIFMELVLLLLWNVGLSFFNQEAPLVLLARVLIGSILIYRLLMGMLRALVLPRWYRQSLQDKKGRDARVRPQELGDEQDEDLFGKLELERAKFIVSTLRYMLLYTLVCQYSLFLVRRAFGMLFVGRWLHVLGYLGYGLVIYALLSLWKDFIARQFARLAGERGERAVQFINTHRDRFYGMVVIFGAFIYVVVLELVRWAQRYLQGLEVTKRVVNFIFRKRIELDKHTQEASADMDPLPEPYIEAFMERPLNESEFLKHRQGELDELMTYLERWRTDGTDGAVAILGEYGMGKTTLLDIAQSRLEGLGPMLRYDIVQKHTNEAEALGLLAEIFGLPRRPLSVAEMAERLLELPRTVVLLDGCHNLYLRRVGGFDAIRTFLQLVSLTNHHHAWLMTFNRFAWRYINRLKDWGKAFLEVELGALTEQELRTLIERRSAETGFELNFRSLAVGTSGGADPSRDVRSANGYFRLLADFSKGNPRVAMRYWLRSLCIGANEKTLDVRLFAVPPMPQVGLSPDFGFMLAAIVQHENLSGSELETIVNVDLATCTMALDIFQEKGIIQLRANSQRASMAPEYFRQVLTYLRTVNFLYD